MKKILFLHGFFTTGSCPMARALKEAFEGTAVGIPTLLGNPYFMMTEFLKERMVVYQALYGDQAYWVRPEDMFFGKVTRDGRTFNRFTEIDKF